MKTELEKIKEEIELKKKELEQLELKTNLKNKEVAIKNLSEFTDLEKCNFFDKLYKLASDQFETSKENGDRNDDDEHYAWEVCMEILARDSTTFWNYYNSLFY
jgi:hypothetical protein